MKRVTGIGGVFFKCEDPEAQKAWYKRHLGLESGPYGGVFRWKQPEAPDRNGYTVWSPFPASTDYFDPSGSPFMFNYRVDDLPRLLDALREEGIEIVGEMQRFDYGRFAWILDPEGNKIELWEPVDEVFDEMYADRKTTG